AHPQEVHVQREILDRIELVVLRQDPDLLSAHVDRGNRGQKAAAVNLVVDVLVGQGDGQGRLLGAVDDGRYLALTANCTGGPLTDLFASLGLELISIVAHGVSFRVVERSRRTQALSVNVESRHLFAWPSSNPMSLPGNAEPAALGRVASKGVYADGGSIADAGRWRKAASCRLSRFLHVWQEDGKQADQRQERADLIDIVDAPGIGHDAQYRRRDSAHAEGEAEEDAGYHADAAGHQLLRKDDNVGEGR